jgi:hypothetical protein
VLVQYQRSPDRKGGNTVNVYPSYEGKRHHEYVSPKAALMTLLLAIRAANNLENRALECYMGTERAGDAL